jgi:hypothetical protein
MHKQAQYGCQKIDDAENPGCPYTVSLIAAHAQKYNPREQMDQIVRGSQIHDTLQREKEAQCADEDKNDTQHTHPFLHQCLFTSFVMVRFYLYASVLLVSLIMKIFFTEKAA